MSSISLTIPPLIDTYGTTQNVSVTQTSSSQPIETQKDSLPSEDQDRLVGIFWMISEHYSSGRSSDDVFEFLIGHDDSIAAFLSNLSLTTLQASFDSFIQESEQESDRKGIFSQLRSTILLSLRHSRYWGWVQEHHEKIDTYMNLLTKDNIQRALRESVDILRPLSDNASLKKVKRKEKSVFLFQQRIHDLKKLSEFSDNGDNQKMIFLVKCASNDLFQTDSNSEASQKSAQLIGKLQALMKVAKEESEALKRLGSLIAQATQMTMQLAQRRAELEKSKNKTTHDSEETSKGEVVYTLHGLSCLQAAREVVFDLFLDEIQRSSIRKKQRKGFDSLLDSLYSQKLDDDEDLPAVSEFPKLSRDELKEIFTYDDMAACRDEEIDFDTITHTILRGLEEGKIQALLKALKELQDQIEDDSELLKQCKKEEIYAFFKEWVKAKKIIFLNVKELEN